MTLGELIRNYRREHDLTLREFAQRCGTSHSYISMLEDGKNSKTGEPMTPTLSTLKKLSTALNLSLDELMSIADDMPVKLKGPEVPLSNYGLRFVARKRFPMLGDIACGKPIFANEEHESYIDASASIDADFCLTARGDSMINAGVKDGDVVFVKSQDIVNNGEIAAVIIDDEATLKRVYYYPKQNKLILSPENPKYPPLIFEGEQLDTINILGKAVCCMIKL